MKSILIVDDNESICKLIAETLGSHYNVKTCGDGEEALQFFKDVDLVLLDMVMPRMNGPECLKKMKELKPEIKVIIMSGYCEEQDLKYCMDNGAVEFFRKPFNPFLLKERINKVLNN